MKLWSKIKAKQLLGYKFRRQHILDKYIVDFFCNDLNLIIEIDGLSHDELRFDKDVVRDEYFKNNGYKILRFSEKEALENIEEVIQSIVNIIDEREIQNPHRPSGTSPSVRRNS